MEEQTKKKRRRLAFVAPAVAATVVGLGVSAAGVLQAPVASTGTGSPAAQADGGGTDYRVQDRDTPRGERDGAPGDRDCPFKDGRGGGEQQGTDSGPSLPQTEI